MNDRAQHGELAVYEPARMMSAQDILAQVRTVQEVMQSVMKEGTHYGKVTTGDKAKPSLWKPGAEILCAMFRIADAYRVEDLSTEDSIRYRITCVGKHQTTGIIMGEGVGECSSDEAKYKWVRTYSQKEFDATPNNRRRYDFYWDKSAREEKQVMQVRTEIADVANTILKMAAKRAKIAMTLNVTAASDIFSQDLEDLDERLRDQVAGEDGGGKAKKSVQQPQSKSKKAAATTGATEGDDAAGKAAAAAAAKEPASDGEIAWLTKHLSGEDGAPTVAEACKAFSMPKLEGITRGRWAAVKAWSKSPAIAPTAEMLGA